MLGSMEMGRAVMVRHVLEEAARAGCRIAVFENATKQDVLDIVATSMTAASINNYTVTVNPDPPQNLSAFEAVTVTVDYADVSWLSSASFMSGSSITGLCVMPAEGDGANDPDSNDTPTGKKNKKNKSKSKSKSKSSGKKNKK
jgi:Flp pilus assembly protein TadG